MASEDVKVSVIVPVYNSEKYLTVAIESVLKQTYRNFELLLIDDGSTDKSGFVCDQYSQKDSRVKVYHKANGGVCSARNFGMNKTMGEYVAFLDNDDEYDKQYLETLLELITHTASDIAKCGRNNIKITEEQRVIRSSKATFKKDQNYSFNTFLYDYDQIKQTGCTDSVWNGIYRMEFIRANGIQFDENLRHGNEDLIFNYQLVEKKPKICVTSKLLYTHYYRLSHSTSMKFFDDQVDSRIKAIEIEQEFVKLIPSVQSRNLIAFEEYRGCFQIVSGCCDEKKKKEMVSIVNQRLDTSFLHNLDVRMLDGDKVRKLDFILFRHHMYGMYFFYKNIQRKVGK